jgi:carbonic anhydrase/acetyltransferase-like protein (isoleucine patch superfamily)
MAKKYELTNETKVFGDRVLHRIKALIDIPKHGVEAGDLGGFIEGENNLSHDGECWIGKNACAYDNAYVYGNARVYDNARICDNAHVGGDAWICGNANVYGKARIRDYAGVSANAQVFGNALIYGNSCILGNASIYGNVCVSGRAYISGNAYTYGNVRVFDNAWIGDNARVSGDACVYGNACVRGESWITQGKYHTFVMNIIMLPYGVTAIYPNHVQIGCGLFEICDKKTAIKTMKEFDIPEKYHEQIWLAVKLCKQWLKDNPEKGENND